MGRKFRHFKKITAGTLVITFSWSQFLYATDVRQMLLLAKKSFEQEDERRVGGSSAAEVELSQSQVQQLMDERNELEHLSEKQQFSLTTQNGDILKYVDGKLRRVDRPDGTSLKNITLDAQGNIASADIMLTDGSVQVYDQGRVVGYRLPNGGQAIYENGVLTRVISKNGQETTYTYIKDAQNNVTEIILENSSQKAWYTPQGRITRSLDKTSQATSFYDSGVIQRIQKQDGTNLIFDIQMIGTDKKIFLANQNEPLNPFQYAIYRQDNSLKEVRDKDGRRLEFNAEGLLTRTTDADGRQVDFDFTQSSLSTIANSQIHQPGGVTSQYDEDGRLKSVTVDQLTIHYKESENTIDYISAQDGTEFHDIVFNAQGALKDARVITADGDERVYKDGKIDSLKKADLTKIFYFNDKPIKLLTNQQITYNFTYSQDKIEAVIDASSSPDALTPIRMEYDTNFNLKKLTRQNQEVLNYLNNDLMRIDYSSDAPQVFTYTRDAQGNLISYKVVQGDVETFYDGQHQVTRALVHHSAQNQHDLDVTYQYGKIREIKKDNVLTFKYTYTFNAQNEELTNIEDLADKVFKVYKDSLLLTSLDQENSVLSSYAYNEAKKVSQVNVTRFGRQLHTYIYTYEGNNTIVGDDENVVRTYDAGQKLIFLEKEGQKFAYSYHMNPDNEEITEEKLIERTLPDGTRAHYQNGQVSSIDLGSGRTVKDLVLDEQRMLVKATLVEADGTQKIFNSTDVLEQILPDNTHFYFDKGMLTRVTDAQGVAVLYTYERNAAGDVTAVWVNKQGVDYQYNLDGSLAGVSIPGVVAQGATDFYDYSDVRQVITAAGETQMSSSQSKFGGSSASFDGNGDNLKITDSDENDFGTGDFTIECFVRFNSIGVGYGLISRNDGLANGYQLEWSSASGGILAWAAGGSGGMSRAWAPTTGQWYHVAVSRAGGMVRLFVDGSQLGAAVSDNRNLTYTSDLYVGSFASGIRSLDGQMDEVRISKGVARYTSDFAVPTQSFVKDAATKLLLHFENKEQSFYKFKENKDAQGVTTGYELDGYAATLSYNNSGQYLSLLYKSATDGNKRIEDAVQSLRTISVVGDTNLKTTFKFGTESVYFDGIGDSLKIPDSEDFNFGSGNFTVDFWARFDATAGYQTLWSQGSPDTSYMDLRYENGAWSFNVAQGISMLTSVSGADAIASNTWYHIAVVRNGSSLMLFRDGVQKGSATFSGTIPNYSNSFSFGNLYAHMDQGHYFKGYLDEFRVSKGTARWTANFTPQATAYASDPQTTLLLHFDNPIKTALNIFAPKPSGKLPTMKTLPYKPYVDTLYTFADGRKGEYVAGLLSKLFDSNDSLVQTYSQAMVNGQMHTYVTKKGLVLDYDAQGNLLGVKTAQGVFNANGSTYFKEDSANKFTVQRTNGVSISTQSPKLGDASILFDGSNTNLWIADSDAYDFGTGDFTIEFWVKPNAGNNCVFLDRGMGGQGYTFEYYNGRLYWTDNNASKKSEAWSPTVGQWSHLAVVRQNSQLHFYANGQELGTGTGHTTALTYSTALYLGSSSNGGINFNGAMDEIRFSKGVARYSSNFTPAATAFLKDANTALLLHGDGADPNYFDLTKEVDAQGNTTAFILDGKNFNKRYTTLQSFDIISADSIYPTGQSGNISVSTVMDYKDKMSVWSMKEPTLAANFASGLASILGLDTLITQEYSSDGTLETQTKADGTVTLFENNKPSKVLDKDGTILIEYSYDVDGNPTRIYLRNARGVLPKEVATAKERIESERVNQLLLLAQQKSLATGSIQTQFAAAKAQLRAQLAALQGQYNDVSGVAAQGKKAKSQKGDALNQIGHAMDDVRIALAGLEGQEADAYAALDTQVAQLSNSIKADANLAFATLSDQEALMKKEILRQEVSPVVYDTYRRILGRDPSSQEYDSWINQVNFESGEEGIDLPRVNESILSLKGDGGHQSFEDSSSFDLTGSTWTVDTWVKLNNLSTNQTIFSQKDNITNYIKLVACTDGSIRFTVNTGGTWTVYFTTPTNTMTAGTWKHIALVRVSGTYKLFVGGVLKLSVTDSDNPANYMGEFKVGLGPENNESLNGDFSEFRISKGVARWTNTFTTLPARGYTWDASTTFLLGTKKANQARLANGQSIALDGQGDYLTTPDHADFDLSNGNWTIDTWLRTNSFSTPQTIFSQKTDGNNYFKLVLNTTGSLNCSVKAASTVVVNFSSAANTITLNDWYHVALVRNGGVYLLYVNGKQLLSVTDADKPANYTGAFKVGISPSDIDFFNGNIDEFRVSKSIARWTAAEFTRPSPFTRYTTDSYTMLLLRGLVDQSGKNKVMTAVGDAKIDANKTYFRGADLPTALQTAIQALPELAQRQAYVASVKSTVTSKINQFLGLADKTSFLASLGLTSQDVVPFSGADAQKILTWINSRGLHFGQSAFISLETLLDQKGISYAREDIAWKSIVIDILTGVITPMDDGDLVISIYALDKVASLYNVSLSGANLTWDDLRALVPSTATANSTRIIAHINGNHFVIITSITADSITYIDPGIGKDKQNESLTVTKEGFLKVWKGYTTLETSKVQTLANYQQKILSTEAARKVRGAFWGSVLGLIASIIVIIVPVLGPVLSFIVNALRVASLAVSIIEKDWLSAATAAVSIGFSDFGRSIANIFHGATQTLGPVGQALNSIGQFFGNAYQAVQGFFGNIAQNFTNFLHGSLGISSNIAAQIVETSVSIGVNFGVSKGLEAMGVNPQIAGFFGSLAAGAIVGGIKPETRNLSGATITQTQNIKASLTQVITLNQIGSLGVHLGLDSAFTNIIGLSLGAIQGDIITNPDTTLKVAFSHINAQFFNSIAQYGFDRLGASLGLNSLMTNLISAPLSGALSAALLGGQNVGLNIINSVRQGILDGITNYTIQFAGNTNPILGSLLSRDLIQNVAQAVGLTNVFNGIFDFIGRTALNAVNVIGGAVQSVFQGVSTFASVIQQRGLAGALDAFKDSIFGRESLESILSQGGMQTYLQNAPRQNVTLPNGQNAQEIAINSKSAVYIDAQGNVIAVKDNHFLRYGTFGVSADGRFGLLTGDAQGPGDGNTNIYFKVGNSQLDSLKVKDQNGQDVIILSPEQDQQHIHIQGFDFWGAVIKIIPFGLSLFLGRGSAEAAGGTIDAASNATQSMKDIVLINGFRPFGFLPDPEPPQYFKPGSPFMNRLNQIGINDSAVTAIPTFNEGGSLLSNVLQWLLTIRTLRQIENTLKSIEKNQPGRPYVPLAYSGSGNSLLLALSDPALNYHDFGVKTAILVGAPFYDIDAKVKSGSLERIVNIYGTDDPGLHSFADLPKIQKRFISSARPLETINIELKDVGHIEYFYQTGEHPTPEQEKASAFIARLTQTALNTQDLQDLLNRLSGVSLSFRDENYTDPSTGLVHRIRTYVVDTKNLPDNL